MSQTISIIIPVYNEAERLSGSLETIIKYLEKQMFESEIIVVDDGSSDDTAAVAEKNFVRMTDSIRTRVIRYEPNRGKGYAVRAGMQAATGDILLFSDADLSTPITEMEKLVAPIRSGALDVAFGSRALDRSLIGTHQPWRREQSGKVFNLVVRLFTGLPFWDTQCGFKAFRTAVFRPLLDVLKIDRFGFDVEFLFVAHRAGLRVQEIPVRWDHSDGSKVNVFRDSQRMFNEVREVRRNMRRGVYNRAIGEINSLKQQNVKSSVASSV